MKLINIKIYKDYATIYWILEVFFYKWQIAKFKIITATDLPYTIGIERMKN